MSDLLKDLVGELPPVLRRLLWWWLVPVLAIVGLVVAWAIFPGWMSKAMMTLGAWMPLVLFGPQFVIMGILFRRQRQIRRAYRESGGRLCGNCLQNLSGLDDVGVCPECGRAYDIERDRTMWKNANIAE
ncbi:MAG: hypothetical protein IPK69_06900 [Phycisphaerales bacterium]|nr:MAG: hypothetical protein IPK69_06900 [Phycisphaerales bacterium]